MGLCHGVFSFHSRDEEIGVPRGSATYSKLHGWLRANPGRPSEGGGPSCGAGSEGLGPRGTAYFPLVRDGRPLAPSGPQVLVTWPCRGHPGPMARPRHDLGTALLRPALLPCRCRC